MQESEVTLKAEVAQVAEDAIILVLPSEKAYDGALVSLVGLLSRQNLSIVYVTLNKPAATLARFFQKEKVSIENMHFVDCVTPLVQPDVQGNERVLYVNPNNLTGISIAVNEFVEALPKPTVVIFDSLATLLVYNSLPEVQRFSIYLCNKIRLSQTRGFLLSVEAEMNPEFLRSLSKVCDKTLRV